MALRSRKNFPLDVCGAAVASHTAVSAPSSTRPGGISAAHVGAHPPHLKKMYVAIKAAGRFLTGCGIPRRKEYSMPFREKMANDLEANTFIGARY